MDAKAGEEQREEPGRSRKVRETTRDWGRERATAGALWGPTLGDGNRQKRVVSEDNIQVPEERYGANLERAFTCALATTTPEASPNSVAGRTD